MHPLYSNGGRQGDGSGDLVTARPVSHILKFRGDPLPRSCSNVFLPVFARAISMLREATVLYMTAPLRTRQLAPECGKPAYSSPLFVSTVVCQPHRSWHLQRCERMHEPDHRHRLSTLGLSGGGSLHSSYACTRPPATAYPDASVLSRPVHFPIGVTVRLGFIDEGVQPFPVARSCELKNASTEDDRGDSAVHEPMGPMCGYNLRLLGRNNGDCRGGVIPDQYFPRAPALQAEMRGSGDIAVAKHSSQPGRPLRQAASQLGPCAGRGTQPLLFQAGSPILSFGRADPVGDTQFAPGLKWLGSQTHHSLLSTRPSAGVIGLDVRTTPCEPARASVFSSADSEKGVETSDRTFGRPQSHLPTDVSSQYMWRSSLLPDEGLDGHGDPDAGLSTHEFKGVNGGLTDEILNTRCHWDYRDFVLCHPERSHALKSGSSRFPKGVCMPQDNSAPGRQQHRQRTAASHPPTWAANTEPDSASCYCLHIVSDIALTLSLPFRYTQTDGMGRLMEQSHTDTKHRQIRTRKVQV
ncbi:hypothetical protein QBC40DRAFT_298268 [Triangularia verruculosa]|uniref:Uncharacterized protein n=1 Tax=Triangularia verruculosa TaxID=2587418 RepID=A0AAN7ATA3_9PEZI|nr:hypothetical protein QBC40DRAFT_298268 [Triangularia verruculosa]